MEHVEFTQCNGSTMFCEYFYVQGYNVRYVPIPSHIDMEKVVENHVKGFQNRRENKKRTEKWVKKHKRRLFIKEKEKKLLARLQKHGSVDGKLP